MATQYLRGGSILRVDLTSGRVATEPTAKYASFLGGRGINTKLVYDSSKPGAGALDPENPIVFGTGPLSATLCPGSSRVEVTAKSPMTGYLGMSNIGGYWGAELKFAGYDHLVITGRAERPSYLAIVDGRVEIRDATSLWGKDTYETPVLVKKDLGQPDAQVLSIGQAGENLVSYSCIMTKVGDAAGRTGMGCVMGSKNLKAIAVRGTNSIRVANPDDYYSACLQAHSKIKANPTFREVSTLGTVGWHKSAHQIGFRVLGNHESTVWDKSEEADQIRWMDETVIKRSGCFGCPVRCMEQHSIPGQGSAVASCTLYTETTWKVKNPDLDVWYETLLQCQRYGIDPISAGSILAWVMELYEKGIISEKDTDGISMTWGSREAIVGVIERIAGRQGFGDLLADDPLTAARRIGRGSEEYLLHVKGMPLYSVNHESYKGQALASAVGPRGDRLRSNAYMVEKGVEMARLASSSQEEFERKKAVYEAEGIKYAGTPKAADARVYEGKAGIVKYFEDIIAVPDLLGSCKWHGPYFGMPMDAVELGKLYSVGSGEQMGEAELMEAAFRVRVLERAFDVREGLTRAEDSLPRRFFTTPTSGKWPEDLLDHAKFEAMKDEYYQLRGFDVETGAPTRLTLEQSGLSDVADELESLGKLPSRLPAAVVVS